MKKSKVHKENHVAPTKYGMGDNYGTGIRAKVGRERDNMILNPLPKNKLNKPPKSLA